MEKIGGWSVILQEVAPNMLIILAKKYIEHRLRSYWLPMYYNSEFRQKSLYNNRTQMVDVVDEVLYLKNRLPSTKEYSVRFLMLPINLLVKIVKVRVLSVM